MRKYEESDISSGEQHRSCYREEDYSPRTSRVLFHLQFQEDMLTELLRLRNHACIGHNTAYIIPSPEIAFFQSSPLSTTALSTPRGARTWSKIARRNNSYRKRGTRSTYYRGASFRCREKTTHASTTSHTHHLL